VATGLLLASQMNCTDTSFENICARYIQTSGARSSAVYGRPFWQRGRRNEMLQDQLVHSTPPFTFCPSGGALQIYLALTSAAVPGFTRELFPNELVRSYLDRSYFSGVETSHKGQRRGVAWSLQSLSGEASRSKHAAPSLRIVYFHTWYYYARHCLTT